MIGRPLPSMEGRWAVTVCVASQAPRGGVSTSHRPRGGLVMTALLCRRRIQGSIYTVSGYSGSFKILSAPCP